LSGKEEQEEGHPVWDSRKKALKEFSSEDLVSSLVSGAISRREALWLCSIAFLNTTGLMALFPRTAEARSRRRRKKRRSKIPLSNGGSSEVTFGVNLAAGEFGKLPGTYGQDYIYPYPQELDYYKSKGRLTIRVPFRWERWQRTLYEPLNPEEMSRVDQLVAQARARDMKLILDAHSGGSYKIDGTDEQKIGTSAVPVSAFADFWKKVATRYKSDSGVYAYGLMSEPNNMPGRSIWPTAAQAAVDAIRQVDTSHTVMVSGDVWGTAKDWRYNNENLNIKDPANKVLYEAHQYFDGTDEGFYNQSYDVEDAYPNIGVDRVRPFVEWLREKGKKGFIGEFGVPGNDQRWNVVLDNFLAYLEAHHVGGAYWAGGPWWGSYPLSIEPADNFTSDKPQMSILQKYR
jgi:endoglucanase